mgnify:CR=1 FL=1
MAQIQQTFTYALPTELYVAGISTVGIGTYTYVGPDTFTVEIDAQGRIIMINPTDPDLPAERKKTINANSSSELPVAYLAVNHKYEDTFTWTEEFVDETLPNGEVYKKQINPDMDDAYDTPRWDAQTGTWKIDQLLKPLRNDAYNEARRRKDYLENYKKAYQFSDAVEAKIDAYLVGITSYMTANPPYQTWKYVTLPTPPAIPKIDAEIVAEFMKVPTPLGFAEDKGASHIMFNANANSTNVSS